MFEVRRAIHIRTGQRAAIDAIDAWLGRHGVEVTAFDDVYAACVHLFRHYEQIPDLALLGADWLSEDEFNIVTYLRQTWPRIGVVVYGETRSTPMLDMLPMMHSCRMESALRKLVAESPQSLLQRLHTKATAMTAPTTTTAPATAPRVGDNGPGVVASRSVPERGPESVPRPVKPPLPTESPRATLTAEELSALLDGLDDS